MSPDDMYQTLEYVRPLAEAYDDGKLDGELINKMFSLYSQSLDHDSQRREARRFFADAGFVGRSEFEEETDDFFQRLFNALSGHESADLVKLNGHRESALKQAYDTHEWRVGD